LVSTKDKVTQCCAGADILVLSAKAITAAKNVDHSCPFGCTEFLSLLQFTFISGL